MKVNWSGVVAVAAVVIAITTYKVQTTRATLTRGEGFPTVLLRGDYSFSTGSA